MLSVDSSASTAEERGADPAYGFTRNGGGRSSTSDKLINGDGDNGDNVVAIITMIPSAGTNEADGDGAMAVITMVPSNGRNKADAINVSPDSI